MKEEYVVIPDLDDLVAEQIAVESESESEDECYDMREFVRSVLV